MFTSVEVSCRTSHASVYRCNIAHQIVLEAGHEATWDLEYLAVMVDYPS